MSGIQTYNKFVLTEIGEIFANQTCTRNADSGIVPDELQFLRSGFLALLPGAVGPAVLGLGHEVLVHAIELVAALAEEAVLVTSPLDLLLGARFGFFGIDCGGIRFALSKLILAYGTVSVASID